MITAKNDISTVVVQLGNSDDKLSQSAWSSFINEVRKIISDFAEHTHFSGGSNWSAPWQNACWVIDLHVDSRTAFLEAMTACRKAYRQDSVAITFGETMFI